MSVNSLCVSFFKTLSHVMDNLHERHDHGDKNVEKTVCAIAALVRRIAKGRNIYASP
jgi:hypothetical protein